MTRRPSYPRLPLVLVAGAGLLLILVAWFLSSDFFVAVLINTGTATLLFSALYVVQRDFLEGRVESLERSTEKAIEQVARSVEDVRRDFTIALESLSEATREKLARENEEDIATVDGFSSAPSFLSAWALFERALDLQAISKDGIRVRLPGSYDRLRFKPDTTQLEDQFLITIETLGGQRLSNTITWTKEEPTDDMFVRVARELKRQGLYGGDKSFDATNIMSQLAKTIEVPLKARAGLGRASPDIGPVIELIGPQWAVTEHGIEGLDHYYVIARGAVSRDNWEWHMSQKTWVDSDEISEALDVARGMWSTEDVGGE